MPTKHIDKLIDAYLDGQLSVKARQRVEAHIRNCPACARLLFDTERVDRELSPTLRAALGQPTPRPMLRHKVRQAIEEKHATRPFNLNWKTPVQFVNAVGTVAVIALLAFGVFAVIQGQIPGIPSTSSITPLGADKGGKDVNKATAAFTPLATSNESASLSAKSSSLGDTLILPTPVPEPARTHTASNATAAPETNNKIQSALAVQQGESEENRALQQIDKTRLPQGTIAFALYNPTPGRQIYEIHFINPDGTNHQQFPLAGVSEPALHPTRNDYTLAFRAWNEPTSPRSLFSGDIAGERPQSITHFWEDAQPDWSPTENRIIFASQRENDRRWRLYSVWGDGSLEVNLRREGRSPTFAPDGYRFAFEGCDNTGKTCGLWVSDLGHSEQEATPILVDPLAKSPDWSPVAEEIAYMANPDGNWDLYLVNSDDSDVRRLTHSLANDGLPTWSPDGEWLAFASDRGGRWGIWLLHVSSGKLHHATTFEYGTLTPPNKPPYNEHDKRYWWDEQLSWRP